MGSNMNQCEEVIDLTDSFCLAAHRSLADFIIELDDSLLDNVQVNAECPSNRRHGVEKRSIESKHSQQTNSRQCRKKITEVRNRSKSGSSSSLGDCPICWDPLGKNPLASTICGHVYCMKCLVTCLKVERKCPTCRRALKGAHSYHPLYLY